MTRTILIALALSAGLIATPVVAQTRPAWPTAQAQAPAAGAYRAYEGDRYGPRPKHSPRGTYNMTAEGRQIMQEAALNAYDPGHREAMHDARDAVMAILLADRLDVSALRRAMDAERRLADQHHARRQAAMLAAFQQLSAQDRKAFAENARAGRERLRERMERRSMERMPVR